MPVPMDDLPDQFRGSAVPEDDLPNIALTREAAPGSIKPGDVEARRKQGEANAARENARNPNVARERLGSGGYSNPLTAALNEFGGGVGDLASGIGNVFTGEAYNNILDNPLAKTALGAVRTVASPFAGLTDAASEAGEATHKFLTNLGLEKGADVGAGLAQSSLDILGGMGAANLPNRAGQAAKAVNPKKYADPNFLKSKRMQANDLKGELVTSEAATADKVKMIKGATESYTESVESIADAAKNNVPTAAQIRERFAPNAKQGDDVGAVFKEGYSTKLQESKDRFKQLYNPLEEEGAKLETAASNYAAAGGKLEAGEGVTGAGRTKPEGIAAKIKQRLSSVDDADFEDDTYNALKAQLDDVPYGDKARVQGAIYEFLGSGKVPEKPTVADLIVERRRLKAGQRAASDDNSKRQFKGLIDGLEEDIAQGSESIATRLFQADKLYATEHAPYFGKGSVTRAIAEGSPQSVVDQIIRPATDKKSVEKITRAYELITDPTQRADIKNAFVNKGVELAFEKGSLSPNKLATWLKRYEDPTGTGNKVLSTVFGSDKEFQSFKSVVNQGQMQTPKSIDKLAADLTKGYARTSESQIKTAEAAQKAVRERIEKQIAEKMTPTGRLATRLESIGSGVFVSGTLRGNASTSLVGGMIALGAGGTAKLLAHAQGRSLLKAIYRSSPGTSQAAATARRVQTFLDELEDDDNGR